MNKINRAFVFDTPIIVDEVNYGDATIHGTAETYQEDKDLCFVSHKITLVSYPCSNTMWTVWMTQNDLNLIIKGHLKKYVFQDLIAA